MATNSDEIAVLNKHPELLLLLAWNLFRIPSPKSADIVSIDEKEMKVKYLVGTKQAMEVIKTHSFSDRERKGSTNKERFMKTVSKHGFPTLPGGTLVIILMWGLNILALIPSLGFQKYALMIYQKELYAWYALYFLIGSHILESLYALSLVAPILKSPAAIFVWLVINLVYGYPQTIRAIKLSAWAKKGKNAAKDK